MWPFDIDKKRKEQTKKKYKIIILSSAFGVFSIGAGTGVMLFYLLQKKPDQTPPPSPLPPSPSPSKYSFGIIEGDGYGLIDATFIGISLQNYTIHVKGNTVVPTMSRVIDFLMFDSSLRFRYGGSNTIIGAYCYLDDPFSEYCYYSDNGGWGISGDVSIFSDSLPITHDDGWYIFTFLTTAKVTIISHSETPNNFADGISNLYLQKP